MKEQITIVGNIGSDPERRQTGSGVTVASFRVACTERRFDEKTGAWVDGSVSWYRVSAFRRLGENALTSLRKGERIIVTGRLRLREWQAGDKRGMEAEIDADALGHDLLWGSTTFHRTPEHARTPDDAPAPHEEPPTREPVAAGGMDGWAPEPDEAPF